MLHEDCSVTTLEKLDNTTYVFKEFQMSDFESDDEFQEFRSLFDKDGQTNINECFLETPLNSIASMDPSVYIPDSITSNPTIFDRDMEQNFDYELYEETVVLTEMSPKSLRDENPFESIVDMMLVKVQPKADQRARYASDGPRFLPDSRKHPMSIQLPNLSRKSCENNEIYGVILTMVTSTNNPKRQRFIHVNGIKYRTDDAIELDYGRIFIPITREEMNHCEKKFPRLSIICKKFDEYTFDLIVFDSLTENKMIEKYVLKDQVDLTKAAKGKQFARDYDLLCYQIIFQLALKRDNHYFLSEIVCQTDLINEQKAPRKALKRKNIFKKKRKGNTNTYNPWKKSNV